MNTTIESMVKRWSDPGARPLFKGSLIDGSGCCCAQGDVLRCAGWTDQQIRDITQSNADKEVAKILGISRGHSVLLRIVNDRADGCPQDVLTSPEKVLGPNAKYVLAFFKHIDGLDLDSWNRVFTAWAAAGDAAWAAARDAAWDAAEDAVRAWDAAWDAAEDAVWAWAAAEDAVRAARDAAWAAAEDAVWAWDAARDAAGECVGISHLASPFFLKFFFDDVQTWKASVDAEGL